MLSKIPREIKRAWSKLPMNRHADAREITVEMDQLASISEFGYWANDKPFLRISIPVEILTMEGAYAYDEQTNPFVAALRNGEEALRAHYDRFQPQNLPEKYRLPVRGLKGEDAPMNTLPWIMNNEAKVSQGEWGLGPEHGISYHGPVTPEKLALEVKRLRLISESIETKGYKPNRHGDIQGYFLRNGDDYRFVVRGGKHRAAVLVNLGWKHVPIRMKRGWPRIIDRALVADWPEVSSGRMDEKLALDIFDAHFQRTPLADL